MDKQDGFRIAEDAIGAAPELAILGLFGFVMYSNFVSGSTSTTGGVGPNPLIHPKLNSPGAVAAGGILSGLQSAVNGANAAAVGALLGALQTISPTVSGDVLAAQNIVRNFNTSTQTQVNKAFSTLWGWATSL